MRNTMLALLVLYGLQVAAQDMSSCPMHKEHQRQTDVEEHGDEAMGFPHDRTTHHFRLTADGGNIEVVVNDPKDTPNLAAVRSHLAHIKSMFSDGNCSIPMFVHGEVPPGVTEMKERTSEISYSFEELKTGGRVWITTKNRDAVNTIHDFLRFQIAEHQTGDAMGITSPERY